jgi:hypothetical protein
MAIINTAIELRQYVQALFAEAMATQPNVITGDIATIVPSHSARDIFPYLGPPPQLTELVDATEMKGLVTDFNISATGTPFYVDNREFKVGIEIRRKDVEDDLLDVIKRRVQQMAMVSARYSEKLVCDLLVNSELGASTYPQAKGYDGCTLIYDTHAALGAEGGTQDNKHTGTGTTVSYVQADINSAIAMLGSFKADNGEPYNQGFKKIWILAPWSMRLAINTALFGQLISTTSNLLTEDFEIVPHYTSRLDAASDHSYYVGVSDVPDRGVMFIDRVPPTFEAVEVGSEYELRYSRYLYATRMRGEAVAGKWQSIVKVYNA